MQKYLNLKVTRIIKEATEAITLILQPLNGEKVNYKAGQFLTFIFRFGERELRRSYSLCSAPGIDPDMAVTIKRVENGEVSRYLLDHLKEGEILQSLYPAGRFTIQPQQDKPRDIFMIGAGSGVAPLFSLLKLLLKEEPQSNIILINSNKSSRHALYEEQLRQLADTHANQFKYISLYSQASEGVIRSRLTIDLLEKLVKEYSRYSSNEARFYLCGPGTYMRMARITLLYMGYNEEQILKETFVTGQQSTYRAVIPATAPARKVTIHLDAQQYTITVPAQQSILDAALAAGLAIPYSCKAGACSTCIARTGPGGVLMAHNEVLTDKEVTEGWILTCTAHPLHDNIAIRV